jgi:hypothetical protein
LEEQKESWDQVRGPTDLQLARVSVAAQRNQHGNTYAKCAVVQDRENTVTLVQVVFPQLVHTSFCCCHLTTPHRTHKHALGHTYTLIARVCSGEKRTQSLSRLN